MKKFLVITAVLCFVVHFVTARYLYVDIESRCFIKVIPTFMPGNLKTPEAISFLKKTSLKDYKTVCENVETINKNPSCGGFDGGCFYEKNAHTIFVGNDQGNIALAAAVIVHETCHVQQGSGDGVFDEQECQDAAKAYLNPITLY